MHLLGLLPTRYIHGPQLSLLCGSTLNSLGKNQKENIITLFGITALFIILAFASPAHAQSIPQITLPVEGPITLQRSPKLQKVESALARLRDRLAQSPSSLQDDTEVEPGARVAGGMVTIEAISTGAGNVLLRDLEKLGLESGAVFGKLVSGHLPLSAITAAESLSSLQFIRLARAITRTGTVDNQADISMNSDDARLAYGIDGTGISIGILSDSFDQLGGAAADISSGDIPSGVNVLDDTALGSNVDEGRAMAQLIHDIAPGANLLFRTAAKGAPDFAQGILDLAAAGADVIVDDIGYLNAPMFQDDVVSQAVDTVVADGVAYFSAAGNSSTDSYEAAYQDSGLSFTGGTYAINNLHEFAAGGTTVQEFTIPAGESILLSVQWDNPSASAGGAGATTDLDAIFVDISSNVLAEANDDNINADAVEMLSYTNETGSAQNIGLVVGVYAGPVPGRLKWIDFSGPTAHNYATNSSTIFAHPNSNGAIATGAARYDLTPAFGTSPPQIEGFSSHGGLQILFDTAGVALGSPQDRSKPDLVAPDGSDTSFFGSSDFDGTGFPNFFGTSAAAPHAAAVAALQLQCAPSLSPLDIFSQQTSTAIDMESAGFDNISGDGLIDAFGATSIACTTPPTQDEVNLVASCLAGNGRVDLNIVNKQAVSALYRLELQGQSPRQTTVASDDWGRMPITGRPPGAYTAIVQRDGETILDSSLSFNCNDPAPTVSSPEVTILNACRAGNGYVLFQMVNPTSSTRPYVIEFEGVSNRSTSATPFGQTVRATTGRPDGAYNYLVRTGSTVIDSGSITVACD